MLHSRSAFTLVEVTGVVAIICILAGVAIYQLGLTRCAILEQAANRELQILNSSYHSYLASGGNRIYGTGTHDEAVAAVVAMKGTVNGIGPFIVSEGTVDLNACQGTPIPVVLVNETFQTPTIGSPAPSPSGTPTSTPSPDPNPSATASATPDPSASTTPAPTPTIQVEGLVIINPAVLSVGQDAVVTLRLTNRNPMEVQTDAAVSSQDEGVFAGALPSFSGILSGNSSVDIQGSGSGIGAGTAFVENSVTTSIGTATVTTPVSVYASSPTPTPVALTHMDILDINGNVLRTLALVGVNGTDTDVHDGPNDWTLISTNKDAPYFGNPANYDYYKHNYYVKLSNGILTIARDGGDGLWKPDGSTYTGPWWYSDGGIDSVVGASKYQYRP